MTISPLLNVYLNYNDTRQPVLVSPASLVPARGILVTGGEKVTLRVYFVNVTGASPTYVVPVETDTIRFSAKKRASDEELVYLFDEWTIGDSYIETTADFATVEGFWASATESSKSLITNIEVETVAGLVRKWSFFTQLVRQSYGGEDPPVNPGETYVKYTAQTPTSEQQAQAIENLGLPAGINDAVLSDGTITAANAGKLAQIDSETKQIKAGPAYSATTVASTLVLRDESGGITSSFFNGDSCEISEGIFGDLTANATFSAGNGAFTISASGVITVTSTGFFRSAIWYGQGAALSGQGTYVSENGVFFYGEGGTTTGSISAEGGSMSLASGSFTVGTTGDMTATHGKFMGSGGQAGHVQLKQGTAPNGTANETTIWGIPGGIGWRNGTGTAYDIAFPTSSGTLALNTAGTTSTAGLLRLATVAESRAGIASDDAVTPEGLRLNRLSSGFRMSWSAASWVGVVSGAGASTASTEFGQELVGPSTATGHAIRYITPSNQAPICRGVNRGVIDWSKRVEFAGVFSLANTPHANTVVRLTWGKVAADTAGDLARSGIGFKITGSGALQAHAHNGTTATTGTDGTFTPTANQNFDYLITLSSGTVTVTVNDTIVATCSGGPTSAGGQAAALIQAEVQNTNTTTTQTTAGHALVSTFIART